MAPRTAERIPAAAPSRSSPTATPTLGLIVNPIAGMGGPVALKGTDGVVEEARQRGAAPVAQTRAARFIARLPAGVRVVTCSGPMGAQACQAAGRSCDVIVDVPDSDTTAEHTRQAAKALREADVDLLVFVGGDGTALDVAEAVGHEGVCLGVPSGVKMNSAVFAERPETAAEIAARFLFEGGESELADVVEVDEARLRAGGVRPVKLGSLRVPVDGAIAGSKAEPGGTVEGLVEAVEALATPGTVLVLGPGSTLFAVKQALVGSGTLLGVDVVVVGPHGGCTLEARDVTAAELEAVPDTAVVVVSPIGGQGFVVGRGNQQIAPALLRRTGWEHLVVVATPEKLRGLSALRADTGDPGLDASAPRRLEVVTGPGFRTLLPLRAGA